MNQRILKLALAIQIITGSASAAPPIITTVATYESMSLYWPWTDDLASATESSVCTAEYRTPAGSGDWLPALNLWSDNQNNTFSGSVVYLDPDTEYEFRLTCDSPAVQTTVTASTRSDTFPEGTVTAIGAQTSLYTIAVGASGTAGGYHVYNAGSLTTSNPGAPVQLYIEPSTHHIIIRDITFTGGQKNCIQIGNNCTDIVIERCTFSGFGEPGLADSYIFPDLRSNSAIASETSASNLERVTIQNCTFISDTSGSIDWTDLKEDRVSGIVADKAFTAVNDEGGGNISFTVADTNDVTVTDNFKVGVVGGSYDTGGGSGWANLYLITGKTSTTLIAAGTFSGTSSGTLDFDNTSHPVGPHAVVFVESIGQHVIRYNRAYATSSDRMFNDVFGGGSNSSLTKGAYGNNSDIHGNDIGWALDDGIECEGSNTNNRIWNNYIHHCHVAIATASIKDGPVYTWQNVVAQCKAERENDTSSSSAWKTGNTSLGRQYWFFNTITQDGTTNGHSEGYSQSGGVSVKYWYARNNIVDVEGRIAYDPAEDTTHNLQFDTIVRVPNYSALADNNYGGATNPPDGVSPPSGGEGYFLGTATFTGGGQFADCNANYITAVSLGYRGGQAVANFGMNATTRATITDPDVGALDPRMPAFVYGVQSSSPSTRNPRPPSKARKLGLLQ